MSENIFSLSYAQLQDKKDPLRKFRKQFLFPKRKNGKNFIYFCGNSLGLQPKKARKATEQVMQAWENLAVEGHFEGEQPWTLFEDSLVEDMANVVGANPHEVALGNTLTANLHFLMISFYRPKPKRHKILLEYNPFPSDRYVAASQADMHGYDPQKAIIELKPKKGSEVVSTEQILDVIQRKGDQITLLLLGMVNYYTGQLYDIKAITKAAHKKGIVVGLDMAHAAGNIPIKLHKLGVDFATWCTYKYMNAGPGNLSGFFVHEKHHHRDLKRLEGWWGNKLSTRFEMREKIDRAVGAEAWILSNPPIISLASLKASMDIFRKTNIKELRKKSIKLTSYLEKLVMSIPSDTIEIITPKDPSQRGAQLSIRVKNSDKSLFDTLVKKGIIGDWREPDVIRISPAPLYNSFEDVYRFYKILKKMVK